ncbi:MAG: CbtB-domain containing protein [Nitrosopumilaceae archaeon]|nr:CbtB-domain containing protein [Nitrosopumilaceae archaeon]
MQYTEQVTSTVSKPPMLAIALLAVVFAFGLFIVGYDQGHLFSIVQGAEAYEELYMHEMTHDMRHAAGFPCH